MSVWCTVYSRSAKVVEARSLWLHLMSVGPQ